MKDITINNFDGTFNGRGDVHLVWDADPTWPDWEMHVPGDPPVSVYLEACDPDDVGEALRETARYLRDTETADQVWSTDSGESYVRYGRWCLTAATEFSDSDRDHLRLDTEEQAAAFFDEWVSLSPSSSATSVSDRRLANAVSPQGKDEP